MSNGLLENRLGVRLDRVVEGREDVLALYLRRRADDVDRPAERVTHDRLGTRPAEEAAVVPILQPLEPLVVDTRIADHLRADRVLGVHAPLLRVEAEAGEILLLQLERFRRIGEPLHVDKLGMLLVEEERVERVRAHAEDVVGSQGDRAGVTHLGRVGVDGGGLFADRELESHPVEDRSSARRDRDELAMLRLGPRCELTALNHLEPERPRERPREGEHEDCEEEVDPAIGLLLAHA